MHRRISENTPDMRGISAEPSVTSTYPLRVFFLMLLLMFSVEGTIMLLLTMYPILAREPLVESLIDASMLTLISAPAVWFLVVRPIQKLFQARGRLLQQLFEAQEQERARIARDLHDEIGQHLTAILVGIRTIETAGDLETARKRALDLHEIGSLAHAEVRRLARGLRPGVLEEFGLAAAIERLCEDFQKSHDIHIALHVDDGARKSAPALVESTMYRILQEAMTNLARHSQAHTAMIILARSNQELRLSISDDGIGFDTEKVLSSGQLDRSFGLGSMRERALLLDGSFELRTETGKGTTIQVILPVKE